MLGTAYWTLELGFAVKVHRAGAQRWEAISLMVPPPSRDHVSGAPGKGGSLLGWVTGGEGQSIEGRPRDCSSIATQPSEAAPASVLRSPECAATMAKK